MLRLVACAAVLTLATSARADGTFFALGGGPIQIDDELGDHVRDGGHFRVGLGHRVGHLAVEGYVGFEAASDHGGHRFEATRLGVDARYVVPLSRGLQIYARGGLSRMSATLGHGDWSERIEREFEGRGAGGGAGVQLRGKVRALGFLYWPLFFVPAGPKVDAAIFIDHGVEFDRLHAVTGPAHSIDARFTRLTIGFHVGGDF